MADFKTMIKGMEEKENPTQEETEKAGKLADSGFKIGEHRFIGKDNNKTNPGFIAYGGNNPDQKLSTKDLANIYDEQQKAKSVSPEQDRLTKLKKDAIAESQATAKKEAPLADKPKQPAPAEFQTDNTRGDMDFDKNEDRKQVGNLWKQNLNLVSQDATPENIKASNQVADQLDEIIGRHATPEQYEKFVSAMQTYKDPAEVETVIDEIMGKEEQPQDLKSYPKDGTIEGAYEFRQKKPVKKAQWGDNIYETEDGEEWFIGNEQQAYNEAVEQIKSIYDDMGLDAFAEEFQDWILQYAISGDFLDQVKEEEAQYMEDDGDIDTAEWMRNLNNKDFVNYLRYDLFGDESEFKNWLKKHNAINLDRVAEEAIDWDGVAHFISSYDGKEVELPNGLVAYRLN